MTSTTPTIVLVHGAFHGPWAWQYLEEILNDRGIATATVALPSTGAEPTALGDLDDDVAATNAVMDGIDGPVVLVAHSYSGVVITQAGERDDVIHLVYITAANPDVGENGYVAFPAGPPAWAVFSEDGGGLGVAPGVLVDTFYGDVDDAKIELAQSRVAPWLSTAAGGQPVTVASWKTRPSTYIVCAQDKAIDPVAQRDLARRATEIVELESSHSPFLSHPSQLADILERIARAG